MRKNIS